MKCCFKIEKVLLKKTVMQVRFKIDVLGHP